MIQNIYPTLPPKTPNASEATILVAKEHTDNFKRSSSWGGGHGWTYVPGSCCVLRTCQGLLGTWGSQDRLIDLKGVNSLPHFSPVFSSWARQPLSLHRFPPGLMEAGIPGTEICKQASGAETQEKTSSGKLLQAESWT